MQVRLDQVAPSGPAPRSSFYPVTTLGVSGLSDWAVLVAVAVGAVVALVNAYLNLLTRRQQLRLEEMKFDLEYRDRKGGAPSDVPPNWSSEQFGRRLRELTRAQQATSELIERVLADLSTSKRTVGSEGDTDRLDAKQMMRELSHSLNTPLSQIEARALVMRARVSDDETATLLAQMVGSVDVCKAYLYAFRLLVDVPVPYEKTSSSLQDTVVAAATSNPAFDAKGLRLHADFLETSGYPTSYILAVILPLVENAVEAASADSTITVATQINEGRLELSVQNRTETPLPHDAVTQGFTTKKGHEGLGLAVVGRLVGIYEGGDLQLSQEGDVVRATATIPATP